MGDLVNMKRTAADIDKDTGPSSMIDEPSYPWGLSLTLDEDSLEKLELDDELPSVGKKFTLIATVEVTSVSSNASKGGERQSVGFQITDMCLEPPGKAATLYKE